MKLSEILWGETTQTLLEARVIRVDDVQALKIATDICQDIQRVLDEIRKQFSSGQSFVEFAFYDSEKFRKKAHEKKGGPFVYEVTLVDGSKVRVACHWEFHSYFRKIDEQPLVLSANALFLGKLEEPENSSPENSSPENSGPENSVPENSGPENSSHDDPLLRAIQRVYASPEGVTYSHILKIFLNPSARKLVQWRNFLARPENLFPELKHELTHIHDLAMQKAKGSFSKGLEGEAWNKFYFNQDIEVRAFMRTVLEEIKDEVLTVLEQNKDLQLKDVLMSVLDRNERWVGDLKKYLTPENKKTFLLGLVKSFEDLLDSTSDSSSSPST
jgi:hypothetical protein